MKPSIPTFAYMTCIAVCFAGVGCGSAPDPWGKSAPSTIEGTVVTGTFPGRASAFTATTESGDTLRAPLDAAGAFSMELPSHHHYRLSVETEGGTVRLIFPRASNRIDDAFALSTTQARITLGSIRYIADPKAQPVSAAPNDCTDGTRNGGAGLCTVTADHSECEDGYRSASPSVCSDLDVVLGYGQLSVLESTGLASGAFAIAAQSPPCEVQGCFVPQDPNPPQTPTN